MRGVEKDESHERELGLGVEGERERVGRVVVVDSSGVVDGLRTGGYYTLGTEGTS